MLWARQSMILQAAEHLAVRPASRHAERALKASQGLFSVVLMARGTWQTHC
jgi:hypothetical protein